MKGNIIVGKAEKRKNTSLYKNKNKLIAWRFGDTNPNSVQNVLFMKLPCNSNDETILLQSVWFLNLLRERKRKEKEKKMEIN